MNGTIEAEIKVKLTDLHDDESIKTPFTKEAELTLEDVAQEVQKRLGEDYFVTQVTEVYHVHGRGRFIIKRKVRSKKDFQWIFIHTYPDHAEITDFIIGHGAQLQEPLPMTNYAQIEKIVEFTRRRMPIK